MTEHLDALKENLAKSDQLTQNMLGVLNSFENRLSKLEETIIPIYKETGALQRRHENIEKTLGSLDQVIGYYNISKESETILRNGPSANLTVYLECMEELQKAVEYFQSRNNADSMEIPKQLSQVMSSYEAGKDALEREFRQLLQRQTTPVAAVVLLDVVAATDDLETSDTVSIRTTELHQMSESVHDDLSRIASWLNSGDHADYMAMYAKVRSANIVKSLEGLKEHFKSGTRESLASLSSPANAKSKGQGKDTPVQRKAAKRLEFFRKASSTIRKQMARLESAGIVKSGTEDDSADIDFYIASVSVVLRLLQSEQTLMNGIIPLNRQRKVFDTLVIAPIDVLVREGERISSSIQQKLTRNEYTAVITIFPVLKHLRAKRSEFDITLEGCQTAVRTKVQSIIFSLDTVGAKALDAFVDSIKTTSEKNMHLPSDGTVHEMTSNTIIFLEQLQEYQETAGAMLLTKDPTSLPNLPAASRSKLKLAEFITKVLSALGYNITHKSTAYTDETLKALFLLNNFNYIHKSLKRSGLLEIIEMWNNEVEKFYIAQTLEQKRVYSQSWSKVIHFIAELKPVNTDSKTPEKLKDKDRQMIKDKFAGFNKELEDLAKTQKTFAIPDPELRLALIQENKDFVLPYYKKFLQRYQDKNFSKTPEKYLKYSLPALEKCMDGFFDSSA